MRGSFARSVGVLCLLYLGGGLAIAADVVSPGTSPPTDGGCLHHTLADKNIVVKLANGEQYDDRLPKRDVAGPSTHGVMSPLHTFLCKNGRVTMLQ